MKFLTELLIKSVGVFLVLGVLSTPAYARSFSTDKYGYWYMYGVNTMLKEEGWHILNDKANQVSYVKNGQFAVGWTEINGDWYYFDPESHFRMQSTTFNDNDKEYYFNMYGKMLRNGNHAGYYYGSDGAKQGIARNATTDVDQTYIEGINGWINVSEAEQLIKDGKIKAKIKYYCMSGSDTSNAMQAVAYYLDPRYKGTVGMTDEEFKKQCDKKEEEFQAVIRNTVNNMSESDFN